ncbi:rubredoxin domain-containing protein [Fibrella forsythiae]|uniref:Rubredoxin domain-containing protein n=1 Tax=Fibrella forsythiae TaxID=2817061 RepID=A0ABS3JCE3_9BACT|nr:rubredoxin domain-containing protein [Fibrella forsythiae]MBO0947674.1 rubredoxin domain-containing protein [Fibrella forsythiae]
MRDYFTVKINLPAGIVSPASLQKVLKLAYEARVRQVRFGSRQQLLISVHGEEMRPFEKALKSEAITYEVDTDNHPNIISSYCGEAVFRSGDWLGESEYHTILDQFDYRPKLKVNLSDANQSFTPFFTGNLNFIASSEPHFWYLYIRPKQSNALFRWRDLVYTNDVGRLAKAVEEALLRSVGEDINANDLYTTVMAGNSFITQPATQEVDLPEFTLPYYEGFNRYGERTWLGIYRRDELFPISFLLDVCALCLKTRIGEICITPWKSLVIKAITGKDRAAWSHVLGKHNINVRHAANELAWQTEDHTDEGTRLKNYVIRFFEKHDTRTFGLCFGIQTRAKSEVFGSILIRRRSVLGLGQLSFFSVYDLYFAENFNPNSRRYTLFERGIFKLHLPARIDRLCHQFNTSRLKLMTVSAEPAELPTPATEQSQPVHQCPSCFTIYDPDYGDLRQNVPAGLPFEQLPTDYHCATCDEPKASFVAVDLNEVMAG